MLRLVRLRKIEAAAMDMLAYLLADFPSIENPDDFAGREYTIPGNLLVALAKALDHKGESDG